MKPYHIAFIIGVLLVATGLAFVEHPLLWSGDDGIAKVLILHGAVILLFAWGSWWGWI